MTEEGHVATKAEADWAYELGRKNRGEGYEIADCPYRDDSTESLSWRDGWLDADAGLTEGFGT